MEEEVFERFRSIIYRESGIVLPPEKRALLSSRIHRRLSALGIKDEREYLQIIELDVAGEELINLIDVVSTNVTHFYREDAHFKFMRDIVKNWRAAGKNDLKIWCAAASSGEEPYTLAFEAMEACERRKEGIKILATDICTKVLKTAVEGRYTEAVVAPVPQDILGRYMERQQSREGTCWQVRPEITDIVLFKKLNLVDFPYPLKGPFDLIFCRNVMIYFDRVTREKIVEQFERLLASGGYLFVSHSENLLGVQHNLMKIQGSVFQKK